MDNMNVHHTKSWATESSVLGWDRQHIFSEGWSINDTNAVGSLFCAPILLFHSANKAPEIATLAFFGPSLALHHIQEKLVLPTSLH
jgi:hypothetical protein